jgi:hypothetical protein
MFTSDRSDYDLNCRSSTLFLKQQLDATSRALKMSQDELERHKMRAASVSQQQTESASQQEEGSAGRGGRTSLSRMTIVRKQHTSSRLASTSR